MHLNDYFNTPSFKLFSLLNRYTEKEKAMFLMKHKKIGVPWMVSSHGEILLSLYVNDKQTMKNMANRIGKDPSTVTTLVKRLKTEKMLDSYRSHEDQRKWVLTLTDKGIEHCRKMENLLIKESSQVSDVITEEELILIEKVLERASGVLDSIIEEVEKS